MSDAESEFDPAKIAALPKYRTADYLRTPEARANFLTEVLNDDGDLASALHHVAQAAGMTATAEAAGVCRPSIYKALRPGAKPRLATALGVIKAAGCRIIIVPIDADQK